MENKMCFSWSDYTDNSRELKVIMVLLSELYSPIFVYNIERRMKVNKRDPFTYKIKSSLSTWDLSVGFYLPPLKVAAWFYFQTYIII